MERTGIYCDRCGKEFRYAQTKWAGILRGLKPKSVKLTNLFYGNVSGYDYSYSCYDLCGECTKELEKFMREKR